MQALKPPGELVTLRNPAENWKTWTQHFEIYKMASGLGNKPKSVQVNTLLHVAGPEAIRIHYTFEYGEDEDKDDLSVLLTKLDDHFLPQKNISYKRHIFHTRIQAPGESIDDFVTDLKRKAATCEFGQLQEILIKDRIIIGIRDVVLRTKLLEKRELTLQQTTDTCRSAELTRTEVGNLTLPSTSSAHQEVNAVRQNYRQNDKNKKEKLPQKTGQSNHNSAGKTFSCRKCGNKHGP